MRPGKLLMISTDRAIFEEGSAVRARQIAYAHEWDEVHIVVFAGRGYREQAIAPNCYAYPTRSFIKALYPLDAIWLSRFIAKRRGITHVTCQDASLTAVAGTSLKRRLGLPLEIQVHEDLGSPNYGFRLSNRIRKSLALSFLPKADTIRVVSDRIKAYLTSALDISAEKIAVKPIAVDVDAVKAAIVTPLGDLHKKYPQFDKIALIAGRFEPEKNFSLAIEAWARVVTERPKAGLVIVGRGSEEAKLKALAARLGVAGPVAFEAWAEPSLLYQYYKSADLYLCTSLFEGYGMALVQAKAAGLPIVSTDVGVAPAVGARIVAWDADFVARGIVESL